MRLHLPPTNSPIPCEIAPATYSTSLLDQLSGPMTDPIIQCILQQFSFLQHHVLDLQQTIFCNLITIKHQVFFDVAKSIRHQRPTDLQHIIQY